MPDLKYEPLPVYTPEETKRIMESGTIEELIVLPLSIGMNCSNWKIAQEHCLKLSKHKDARVRANTVLGFAYIAMMHGKLEKHLIKPILLNEMRTNVDKSRIQDAIDFINHYLKWGIGLKGK